MNLLVQLSYPKILLAGGVLSLGNLRRRVKGTRKYCLQLRDVLIAQHEIEGLVQITLCSCDVTVVGAKCVLVFQCFEHLLAARESERD